MKTKLMAAVIILLATTTSAQAETSTTMPFSPYIGLDVQRSLYSYNKNYDLEGFGLDGNKLLADTLDGVNIHIGSRVHRNLGVELGYFQSQEEGKNIAEGSEIGADVVAAGDYATDVKIHGVTLDALGYLPIDDAQKLELIGTAGITWTKAEMEFNAPGFLVSEKMNESEIGFRLGAGAQYNFNEHLSARGLVRYQKADFDNVADRAWTYSAGLNYSF